MTTGIVIIAAALVILTVGIPIEGWARKRAARHRAEQRATQRRAARPQPMHRVEGTPRKLSATGATERWIAEARRLTADVDHLDQVNTELRFELSIRPPADPITRHLAISGRRSTEQIGIDLGIGLEVVKQRLANLLILGLVESAQWGHTTVWYFTPGARAALPSHTLDDVVVDAELIDSGDTLDRFRLMGLGDIAETLAS